MSIKVLTGKDIVTFYANTKIESCMTGKKHSKKIEFYAKNPKKISLITYKDKARAIMWRSDSGIIVYDEVYSLDKKSDRKIREWCFENNVLPVCSVTKSVSLNITLNKHKHLPFLDSFKVNKFGSKKVKLISLCQN